MDEISQILERCPEDEVNERNRLFVMCYSEVRRWAGYLLRGERQGHTLRPTDLLHEAFLRFKLPNDPRYVVRNLVDLMRKVLIDHARRKLTQKRQHARVPMDSAIESLGKEGVNLLDFEDELRLLEQDGERGQQIALALKLRFFTGFSIQEIATMMECSTKQVGNLLRFGKRWIGNRVQHNHEDREER